MTQRTHSQLPPVLLQMCMLGKHESDELHAASA